MVSPLALSSPNPAKILIPKAPDAVKTTSPIAKIAKEALTELPQTKKASTWYSYHWTVYATAAGALTALIRIIVGIALGSTDLISSGVFFFVTGFIGSYCTYNSRFLRNIEDYNQQLASVNSDLGEKNKQISALTAQLCKINDEFHAQQVKYLQALKENNDVESKLHSQLAQVEEDLKQTTILLNRAQEQAAGELTKKANLYQDAEQKLEDEIKRETAQIEALNQAAKAEKDEIDSLHLQQKTFDQQLAQYKQTNAEYAAHTDSLQKQIAILQKTLSEQKVDSSSVQANQKQLKKLIEDHSATSAKIEGNSVQFNQMIDEVAALNKRLTQIASKIPTTREKP